MKAARDLLLLAALAALIAAPAAADGPGEIGFADDSVEIAEETGMAMIVVERGSGDDGAVSVDYETVAGSAAADGDYASTSGTLTWDDGDDGDRVFGVPILDDDDGEGEEIFFVVLSSPGGGATLDDGSSSAEIVILASDGGDDGEGDDGEGDDEGEDDGPGSFKFDESSFEVFEEEGMATVTVERSGGESGVVSVDVFTTGGGSATEGADYTAVSETLTWAAGDGADKTFNVPIFDDAEAEGEETIALMLSNATGGASIDPVESTSTIVILASDGGGGDDGGGDDGGAAGALKFDEGSFEVLEDAGVAIVRVERSHGESGEVSVAYTAFGGSATEGSDYTAVSGTLTWFDGDGSDKTFVVPILDDDEAEGAETIDLELSNPTGGAGIDGERGTSVIVILANDNGAGGEDGGTDPGILKFDETSFEVIEETLVATITVERSMGETGAVSVDYATAAGSATAGADYLDTSGTLTWAAGDGADKTFTVAILDDAEDEGAETIELELSGATGGAVVDALGGSSVLVILASDGAPGDDPPGDGGGGGAPGVLKFSAGAYQALEGAGMAVITVERSQGESGAVSVDYATFDGTATDGEDYTGVSCTLSWANGDGGNRTILVPVAGDEVPEGNETLELRLSNATGGAAVDSRRGSAALTIVDDDAAACAPGSEVMCLAGGRFEIGVLWRTFDGQVGRGRAVTLSDESGLFTFFGPGNFEILIKVLDACRAFGSHWVFFSATTNVEVELTVTDTVSGQTKTYFNPLGQAFQPTQDTGTFTACN